MTAAAMAVAVVAVVVMAAMAAMAVAVATAAGKAKQRGEGHVAAQRVHGILSARNLPIHSPQPLPNHKSIP